MPRYAAKLLFQFRIELDDASKRRICEERIINFNASSPRTAISKADQRGKQAEFSYENDEGNTVRFEFIGIADIMALGTEAADDEVWYEIHERMTPMERRDKLIPTQAMLRARLENQKIRDGYV